MKDKYITTASYNIKIINTPYNELSNYLISKNNLIIDLKGNLYLFFNESNLDEDVDIEEIYSIRKFFARLDGILENEWLFENLIIDGLFLILKISQYISKKIFSKLWEIVYKKNVNILILDINKTLDAVYFDFLK